MKNTEDAVLIEIFRGTAWEAGMVKSLLENAEVHAFLKDELMGMLEPFQTSPGGAGPVKVMISSADAELAQQVVDEYVR